MPFKYFLWMGLIVAVSCLPLRADEPTAAKSEFSFDLPADTSSLDPAAMIAAADRPYEPPPFQEVWQCTEPVRLHSGLAISRNGKRVVACLRTGGYIILDGDTGKVLHKQAERLATPISLVNLHPDGKLLALGLENGHVLILDVDKHEVLHRHTHATKRIRCLRITDDATRVSYLDDVMIFHTAALDGSEHRHVTFSETDNRPLQPGLLVSTEAAVQSALNYVHPNMLKSAAITVNGNSILLVPSEFSNVYASLKFEPPKFESKASKIKHQDRAHRCAIQFSNRYFGALCYEGMLCVAALQTHLQNSPVRRSEIQLTGNTERGMQLDFSSDGRWCFLLGQGQVEIYPMDLMRYASLHTIPIRNTIQAAMAVDAGRIVVVGNDGMLHLFELPEFPEAPAWTFSRSIAALAKAKKYSVLDELGELLNARKTRFAWSEKEHDCLQLQFNALNYHDWRWQPKPPAQTIVDEWLKVRPNSPYALSFKADLLIDEGWEARGDGFANTVSPQGWKVFHEKLAEARKLLLPLVKLERPPALAYFHLVNVAKGESWDRIDLLNYMQKHNQLYPQHRMPHYALTEMLMPRWGGGIHDSAEYAARVANQANGDAGDVMYAYLAKQISYYHRSPELFLVLGFDDERVARGCAVLQDDPRTFSEGIHLELWFAFVKGDKDRMRALREQIREERIPYPNGVMQDRSIYQSIFMDLLDQNQSPLEKFQSEISS